MMNTEVVVNQEQPKSASKKPLPLPSKPLPHVPDKKTLPSPPVKPIKNLTQSKSNNATLDGMTSPIQIETKPQTKSDSSWSPRSPSSNRQSQMSPLSNRKNYLSPPHSLSDESNISSNKEFSGPSLANPFETNPFQDNDDDEDTDEEKTLQENSGKDDDKNDNEDSETSDNDVRNNIADDPFSIDLTEDEEPPAPMSSPKQNSKTSSPDSQSVQKLSPFEDSPFSSTSSTSPPKKEEPPKFIAVKPTSPRNVSVPISINSLSSPFEETTQNSVSPIQELIKMESPFIDGGDASSPTAPPSTVSPRSLHKSGNVAVGSYRNTVRIKEDTETSHLKSSSSSNSIPAAISTTKKSSPSTPTSHEITEPSFSTEHSQDSHTDQHSSDDSIGSNFVQYTAEELDLGLIPLVRRYKFQTPKRIFSRPKIVPPPPAVVTELPTPGKRIRTATSNDVGETKNNRYDRSLSVMIEPRNFNPLAFSQANRSPSLSYAPSPIFSSAPTTPKFGTDSSTSSEDSLRSSKSGSSSPGSRSPSASKASSSSLKRVNTLGNISSQYKNPFDDEPKLSTSTSSNSLTQSKSSKKRNLSSSNKKSKQPTVTEEDEEQGRGEGGADEEGEEILSTSPTTNTLNRSRSNGDGSRKKKKLKVSRELGEDPDKNDNPTF
eukprot:TRINITY_DN7462_c0_g1_i1.p1 TRINITY_DN7462_c0_g1~~TRINITY_DN7462_c0_g1_i1.p1  ORF type:complete len:658 (-),score=205.92 TRINITY_DN7462_c0_g1_i1:280-2253(-)